MFNYKIAPSTFRKIGLFLFIASWVLWAVLIVITFLMPVPISKKIFLIGIFYVLKQLFFYTAIYILKKIYFIRFLRKYRFLRTTARIGRELEKKIRAIPTYFIGKKKGRNEPRPGD
jgi:hypothetical protein